MQWHWNNGDFAFRTDDLGGVVGTNSLVGGHLVDGNHAYKAREAKEALRVSIELWLTNQRSYDEVLGRLHR